MKQLLGWWSVIGGILLSQGVGRLAEHPVTRPAVAVLAAGSCEADGALLRGCVTAKWPWLECCRVHVSQSTACQVTAGDVVVVTGHRRDIAALAAAGDVVAEFDAERGEWRLR